MIILLRGPITVRLKKSKESKMADPILISEKNTADVINMRKIELLLDVLGQIDAANSPDVYALKINILLFFY